LTGLFGNEEIFGDVAVTVSAGKVPEDVQFAGREIFFTQMLGQMSHHL
jgi:hypothetical protein